MKLLIDILFLKKGSSSVTFILASNILSINEIILNLKDWFIYNEGMIGHIFISKFFKQNSILLSSFKMMYGVDIETNLYFSKFILFSKILIFLSLI